MALSKYLTREIDIADLQQMRVPTFFNQVEWATFRKVLRDRNDVYEISETYDNHATFKKIAGYKLKNTEACPDFDW